MHSIPFGISEGGLVIIYAVLSSIVYEIGKRFTLAKNSQ